MVGVWVWGQKSVLYLFYYFLDDFSNQGLQLSYHILWYYTCTLQVPEAVAKSGKVLLVGVLEYILGKQNMLGSNGWITSIQLLEPSTSPSFQL